MLVSVLRFLAKTNTSTNNEAATPNNQQVPNCEQQTIHNHKQPVPNCQIHLSAKQTNCKQQPSMEPTSQQLLASTRWKR